MKRPESLSRGVEEIPRTLCHWPDLALAGRRQYRKTRGALFPESTVRAGACAGRDSKHRQRLMQLFRRLVVQINERHLMRVQGCAPEKRQIIAEPGQRLRK